jgi:uncharacterized membrane protein
MAAPEIGTCVSAGIAGLKKNFVLHVVTTLAILVVGGFSFGLLYGPMIAGYMRMIKVEEEGGTPQIGDVFKGFDDFVPAFLAAFLGGIAVSIGTMLCIIPGLLIMALPITATYLVAFGEKDGINALKRAFELVKANLIPSALCALVLGIVGSLGAILCGIGILLTLPIAFIGMYHMAKQMVGDGGTTA